MRSREIRSSFLEYFQRNGHTIVPSSSLVPGDDPTLLFTNAGHEPVQGRRSSAGRSAPTRAPTTSQKCMRVSGKHNDLDNVGPSLRHHTFFEMLGNFSFGDYFKKEAIPFAWELLTGGVEAAGRSALPHHLQGRSAAFRATTRRTRSGRSSCRPNAISELGAGRQLLADGRHRARAAAARRSTTSAGRDLPVRRGAPGGRCRGLECSCDRYVEIWNNVFMEFDRQADGTLKPLPAPSIDTGMGLERITAVIQGKLSNYDTDLFTPILDAIGERAGRPYGATMDDPRDVSMRVIADHLRAMTFLIADGVVPSNEWRGYVLRKIMRRAMRHGKKLGFTRAVPARRSWTWSSREMGDAYPELRRNRDDDRPRRAQRGRAVRRGADRRTAPARGGARSRGGSGRASCRATRRSGCTTRSACRSTSWRTSPSQRQLAIDREGFERAMEGQREKARAGSAFKGGDKALALTMPPELEQTLDASRRRVRGLRRRPSLQGVPVLALFDESGASVDELPAGATRLRRRSRGRRSTSRPAARCRTAAHLRRATGPRPSVERIDPAGASRPRLHLVRVENGSLQPRSDRHRGSRQTTCATRRAAITPPRTCCTRRCGRCSAAHVKQAGSLVAPDRLRFDFVALRGAHAASSSIEIERIVNEQIVRNTPVQTEVRSTEEAIAAARWRCSAKSTATASASCRCPASAWSCAAARTCARPATSGSSSITEESGVAAGVRRIEALTGAGAVARSQQQRAALDSGAGAR